MEVRTNTQLQNTLGSDQNKTLLDLFFLNSKTLGHDSLKVDSHLFVEAASKNNVQFEFIRLKSFDLNKSCMDMSCSSSVLLEADFGIADSGQLIIDTQDPDIIMKMLLVNSLFIILPASKILPSMTEYELLDRKPVIDMFQGVSSYTAISSHSKLAFSSKNIQIQVYVIEDL